VATCSPHQDTGLTNQLHTLLTTDKLKYNMDKYDMQAQNRSVKTTLYKHYRMNYAQSLTEIFAQVPAAGWMS